MKLNLATVKGFAQNTYFKGMYQLKKAAPDLSIAGGLISGLAAGVMFARAYKRHDEVFGEVMADIVEVREELAAARVIADMANDTGVLEPGSTAKVNYKGLAVLYGEVFGLGIRHYGPSIAMAATSTYLILTGYGVIKGRGKAMFATVQLLDQALKRYRTQVSAEFGPEVEERLYYGTGSQSVVDRVTGEDGKVTKTKRDENVIPEVVESSSAIYAAVFDETNPNFKKERALNRFFLATNLQYMNDLLSIRGVVLLNDVYDALGIPRTSVGAVAGWSLSGDGDNFIDFGLDLPMNSHNRDARFLLDFNVNGSVYGDLG